MDLGYVLHRGFISVPGETKQTPWGWDSLILKSPSVLKEIKILDVRKHLSVQVHPHRCGEIWVFLQAPKEGYIYLGLKDDIGLETFLAKVAAGDASLVDCLEKLYIDEGDIIKIPGGTIHCLTEGSQVIELKDMDFNGEEACVSPTFRLWDWGSTRELHVAEASGVLRELFREGLYKRIWIDIEDLAL